jgi:hypothetical protein
MYIDKKLKSSLIGRIVVDAIDMGGRAAVGLVLSDGAHIGIEGRCELVGFDGPGELKSLQLFRIKQERGKYIKFMFKKKPCDKYRHIVKVDMSENKFDGADAVNIDSNSGIWITEGNPKTPRGKKKCQTAASRPRFPARAPMKKRKCRK